MAPEKSKVTTRLSWSIEFGMPQVEPVIYTSERFKSSVQAAAVACVNTIVTDYMLDHDLASALGERLNYTSVTIRSGTEVPGMSRDANLDIGTLTPDKTHEPDAHAEYDVYIPIEAVAEESRFILDAATLHDSSLPKKSRYNKPSPCNLDAQSAVERALQVSFSRRLIKYSLLPSGCIPPHLMATKFKQWCEDSRVQSMLATCKSLKPEVLLENYQMNEIALKGLRQELWANSVQPKMLGLSRMTHTPFFVRYLALAAHSAVHMVRPDPAVPLPTYSSEEVNELLSHVYMPPKPLLRLV